MNYELKIMNYELCIVNYAFYLFLIYEEILVGSLLGDGGGDLCGGVCRRSETVYA